MFCSSSIFLHWEGDLTQWSLNSGFAVRVVDLTLTEWDDNLTFFYINLHELVI